MSWTIGQSVQCPRAGKNAIVTTIQESPWGGLQVQLEADEIFPLLAKDNPRRRLWVHETHIEGSNSSCNQTSI